jgi:metal-responsive CopG/Arc/MetJ family transcriptional regulator
MRRVITVRTDRKLRQALDKKAAAGGKTLSEVVREILEQAVAATSIGERTAHLQGRLSLRTRNLNPIRKRIRARNWRP